MVRVLALGSYPLDMVPAQRYRIEQWAPWLKREGIEVTFQPFAGGRTAALLYQPGRVGSKIVSIGGDIFRQVGRALVPRRYDAVFVAREAALVGPAWYEWLASKQRPVIFDFDDALWLPQQGSLNSRWRWVRSPGKFKELCRMATHVIAGNEFLAQHARSFGAQVSVVPSTVDLDRYGPPRVHANVALPTVGWMGSHSTAAYLEEILPALAEASKKIPFRLLVVGAKVEQLPGFQTACRPWVASREADDLREMDVGLMPMPDNEWTQGKCAMKAIQYLAVGVPVVASPVGATREVVIEGVTGRLASSAGAWGEAISLLLRDSALRARMGESGRQLVEQKYSANSQAAGIARLVRGVVGQ